MTVGEPCASLVMDTFPLTAPAALGANLTVKVADAPALSVDDALMPVAVNPVPVVVTPEICTAA
jgi:hypothetical protein